jgi:adenosylcobinamide-GDP ribazoletransferase
MKAFWIALSTLSCFPSPVLKLQKSDFKNSPAYYPLIGGILGVSLGLITIVPVAQSLQTLLILILWVVMTLGFHLDGLADCLDGWLGGKNPSDRRRIMKGSTLGSYGVTGITLALLSKFILVNHLLLQPDSWKWLVSIPTAARFAASFSCRFASSPKGVKGLGKEVLGISNTTLWVSLAISLVVLLPCLQWNSFLLLGGSLLVSILIQTLSKNKIGGLTGDGLGATIEIAEILGLWLSNIHL